MLSFCTYKNIYANSLQPVTTNGVNWCDIGGLNLTSSGSKAKRELPVDLALFAAEAVGFSL
jgi:hypothetical protein